ncbi:MAG: TlpA family protein disulfide reductase, partial [Alphaproteobacteria bacterium]|nr:TlpA family protein disulfide reductase [Alphaproteobacteria bacterium]
LNFWASWCGPCVEEFPALVGIAEKYTDKVVFLAVSEDLEITRVHMFLEKMQAQGVNTVRPNILITREEGQDIAHKLYQTFRLPETYIIGPDLKIKGKLIGAEWKPATLHALIDSL